MEPTYLEKCVLLMEGNAGVSLAYSWLRVTGAEERVWKSESLDLDRLRYYNHVSISAVFRREIGLEDGGFCAAMREGYEDWEFWLRLGARGYRGEVIPEMLVNYRRHAAAFMNRARKRHAELFDDIYRRNPAVFERRRCPPRRPAGLPGPPRAQPLRQSGRSGPVRPDAADGRAGPVGQCGFRYGRPAGETAAQRSGTVRRPDGSGSRAAADALQCGDDEAR